MPRKAQDRPWFDCKQCGIHFEGRPRDWKTPRQFCGHPCKGRYLKRPPLERFWDKVVKTDTCWNWVGAKSKLGYGTFWISNQRGFINAHRFVLGLDGWMIPKGFETDHLCRNRLCVNPSHLEVVTRRENNLRGTGAAARNSRKTQCIHGHELIGENLVIDSLGRRVCKTCRRRNDRAKQRRKIECSKG